jgi:hypothetical protein
MTTAIECKLHRAGGSIIPLDGIEYHFAPQADGSHVANVENEEHIDRFLSITEAYRLYRGAVAAPAAPAEATAAPEAQADSGDDERAALVAQFEALYGETPHARTGVKKLREMIAAKQ